MTVVSEAGSGILALQIEIRPGNIAMHVIEPQQAPTALQGADAATLAKVHNEPNTLGESGLRSRPPRRIDGLLCPFCAGAIPEEFVFCTHCGRDV